MVAVKHTFDVDLIGSVYETRDNKEILVSTPRVARFEVLAADQDSAVKLARNRAFLRALLELPRADGATVDLSTLTDEQLSNCSSKYDVICTQVRRV